MQSIIIVLTNMSDCDGKVAIVIFSSNNASLAYKLLMQLFKIVSVKLLAEPEIQFMYI